LASVFTPGSLPGPANPIPADFEAAVRSIDIAEPGAANRPAGSFVNRSERRVDPSDCAIHRHYS